MVQATPVNAPKTMTLATAKRITITKGSMLASNYCVPVSVAPLTFSLKSSCASSFESSLSCLGVAAIKL